MIGVRRCPVCRERQAPDWRFSCSPCYRVMPVSMRADVIRAWRRRVLDPARYSEVLAGVITWYRERSINRK